MLEMNQAEKSDSQLGPSPPGIQEPTRFASPSSRHLILCTKYARTHAMGAENGNRPPPLPALRRPAYMRPLLLTTGFEVTMLSLHEEGLSYRLNARNVGLSENTVK
jgi:hypothetical protein